MFFLYLSVDNGNLLHTFHLWDVMMPPCYFVHNIYFYHNYTPITIEAFIGFQGLILILIFHSLTKRFSIRFLWIHLDEFKNLNNVLFWVNVPWVCMISTSFYNYLPLLLFRKPKRETFTFRSSFIVYIVTWLRTVVQWCISKQAF